MSTGGRQKIPAKGPLPNATPMNSPNGVPALTYFPYPNWGPFRLPHACINRRGSARLGQIDKLILVYVRAFYNPIKSVVTVNDRQAEIHSYSKLNAPTQNSLSQCKSRNLSASEIVFNNTFIPQLFIVPAKCDE